MNEEKPGLRLRQTQHICGHLWQWYCVLVNKVMVVTIKLLKWWLQF